MKEFFKPTIVKILTTLCIIAFIIFAKLLYNPLANDNNVILYKISNIFILPLRFLPKINASTPFVFWKFYEIIFIIIFLLYIYIIACIIIFIVNRLVKK